MLQLFSDKTAPTVKTNILPYIKDILVFLAFQRMSKSAINGGYVFVMFLIVAKANKELDPATDETVAYKSVSALLTVL